MSTLEDLLKELNEDTPIHAPTDVLNNLRQTLQNAKTRGTSDLGAAHKHVLMPCRHISAFKRLNKISEGTYGIVFRAQELATKNIKAVKKIKMGLLKEYGYGFPHRILGEINVLLNCDHPNIVQVQEVCVGDTNDEVYLIMEYVESDLKRWMKSLPAPLQPQHIKNLLMQIFRATAYIHRNSLVHRDYKTSNLLISGTGVVKLCDFGLARHNPEEARTMQIMTMVYRSPEVMFESQELFSAKMDMWSLGVVFAELAIGEVPFKQWQKPNAKPDTLEAEVDVIQEAIQLLGCTHQTFEIFKKHSKKRDKAERLFSAIDITPCNPAVKDRFSGKLTPWGIDLLRHLLDWNPKTRLSAEEALKHPYFTEEEPLPCENSSLPPILDAHRASSSNHHSKRPRSSDEEKNKVNGGGAGGQEGALVPPQDGGGDVNDDDVASSGVHSSRSTVPPAQQIEPANEL